ncbi:hypothetical protein D9757_010430 [Collybiopsis confluens]|uniref:Heme haloperoxidase family profile domain-containing protein n=1 Tax=Collybiopsis confluens TaxID=2823264 RepID=A0A8H5LTF2_9AGAR|nr:hypothetical protein D9757_010430 [Collybiopsis confluens]
MKLLFSSFLAVLAVSTGVRGDDSTITNDQIDWRAHQWKAPGPNDSRGPCPGLNTLANHGFLPRNGSNITIPIVLQAIDEGFNFKPIEVLRTAAKLGLLSTDSVDFFSLTDLALPGTLEHDVSLSRSDFALGDNIHFNETIFATLNNSNPGFDFYNTTSAAQVLNQRLIDDKIANPGLINTLKEFFLRSFESAFYLSVMGNVTTGVAPKKFVQVLFQEERLPLEEGWKRSEIPIDDDTLGNVVGQIEIAYSANWAPSGEVICPWIRLEPEGDVTIVSGPGSSQEGGGQ